MGGDDGVEVGESSARLCRPRRRGAMRLCHEAAGDGGEDETEAVAATAEAVAPGGGKKRMRTSEIVQPPKPPPVIREPKTPETPIAISTKASSSGHETSYSSRSEACDRSMSAPTLV